MADHRYYETRADLDGEGLKWHRCWECTKAKPFADSFDGGCCPACGGGYVFPPDRYSDGTTSCNVCGMQFQPWGRTRNGAHFLLETAPVLDYAGRIRYAD